MSYIVFDLEWNCGYPHGSEPVLDEIIQIGAVKLDTWQRMDDTFREFVRPRIHRTLHHHVRKMVPFAKEELKSAAGFPEVVDAFRRWCGEGAVLVSWGPSDPMVLRRNLKQYHLDDSWITSVYDLQDAYDVMIGRTNQNVGLETAVAALGLQAGEDYHDALTDARCTAQVGMELVRRLNRLPTKGEIQREKSVQAALRRAMTLQSVADRLTSTLEQEEPVLRRELKGYPTLTRCLSSREARCFPCPQCGANLLSMNWFDGGTGHVTRGGCREHGRYYVCLTAAESKGKWNGELNIYPEGSGLAPVYQKLRHLTQPEELEPLPKKRGGRISLRRPRPRSRKPRTERKQG